MSPTEEAQKKMVKHLKRTRLPTNQIREWTQGMELWDWKHTFVCDFQYGPICGVDCYGRLRWRSIVGGRRRAVLHTWESIQYFTHTHMWLYSILAGIPSKNIPAPQIDRNYIFSSIHIALLSSWWNTCMVSNVVHQVIGCQFHEKIVVLFLSNIWICDAIFPKSGKENLSIKTMIISYNIVSILTIFVLSMRAPFVKIVWMWTLQRLCMCVGAFGRKRSLCFMMPTTHSPYRLLSSWVITTRGMITEILLPPAIWRTDIIRYSAIFH